MSCIMGIMSCLCNKLKHAYQYQFRTRFIQPGVIGWRTLDFIGSFAIQFILKSVIYNMN